MTPVLIGSEAYPGDNVTTDQQILQVIMSSSNPIHHPAGTNRMGLANDSMAVVDSQDTLGVSLQQPLALLYTLVDPCAFSCSSGHRRECVRVVDASAFAGHPQASVCKYYLFIKWLSPANW